MKIALFILAAPIAAYLINLMVAQAVMRLYRFFTRY